MPDTITRQPTSLGNMPPALQHGESVCTFGGMGAPGHASFTAIEFVYCGAQPAGVRRISLPLVNFDGASQALVRLVDVGRNALVARGQVDWKGRPSGLAQVISWSRLAGGDALLLRDEHGLQPWHHYRLSLCAQPLGAAASTGCPPGHGLWGWLGNAGGDAGGYIVDDCAVPGLAPAWRIELSS